MDEEFLLKPWEVYDESKIFFLLETEDDLSKFLRTTYFETFLSPHEIQQGCNQSRVQGNLAKAALDSLNVIIKDVNFSKSLHIGEDNLSFELREKLHFNKDSFNPSFLNRLILEEFFPNSIKCWQIGKTPLKTTHEVILNSMIELVKIDDPEIFDLFWCSRPDETNTFLRAIKFDCRFSGKNFALHGNPGTGKSSFLKFILLKSDLKSGKYYPMMINCQSLEGQDTTGKISTLRYRLIDEMRNYFVEIGKPNNKLFMKIGEDLDSDLVIAKDHLFQNISKEDQIKKSFPLLIIDDVDYLELDIQHELLGMLCDFIASDRVTVIYACRNPALKEILFHLNERPRQLFKERVQELPLSSISSQRILARRMAYTLDCEKSKMEIKGRWPDLSIGQKRKSTFEKFIRKFGITLDNAQKITYPFTGQQEYIMNLLSNGDIRVIFSLAQKIINYLIVNLDNFNPNQDGTILLGRKLLLEIFTDFEGREYQPPGLEANSLDMDKIINIHQFKSPPLSNNIAHGPSLLQNILEMLRIEAYINKGSRFWEVLNNKLGHSDDFISKGLVYCERMRLIEPSFISTITLMGAKEEKGNFPYILTDKGKFYIDELFYWNEYVDLFGKGEVSVKEVDDLCPPSRLYYDILEFFSALLLRTSKKSGYIKIPKLELFDFFLLKYRTNFSLSYDCDFKLDEERDLSEECLITFDHFENEVIRPRNQGVCSNHKQDRNFFLVKNQKTLLEARKVGIFFGDEIQFPKYKFTHQEIDSFLAKHGAQ